MVIGASPGEPENLRSYFQFNDRVVCDCNGWNEALAANAPSVRCHSMPLYFFHVRGGPSDADDGEGLEYSDDNAARKAALAGARSLIAADVLEGILNLSSRIDVADAQGRLLFSVSFARSVTQA